ncbi:TatD family hydrolase [Flavihumibacter sp. R14]|nr:TatD family hydrolase [Flavihumibacter soli]
MLLTDTHTHLYYETDAAKRHDLIQRCFENKVERLFLPNVNSATVPLVLGLCNDFPGNIFPMIGLHPCDVKKTSDGEVLNYREELDTLRKVMGDTRFYAVGEIGIDLYWDKTTLDIQREAFITQINWAKEMGLPIVIHCRDAFDEVFDVLKEQKDEKLRGIFHCFTGNAEQAQEVIDLGFLLGIGGVVTYKNSGLDKVVAGQDLKDIVLETDSPYLTPVPFRGKPNESSYLIHVAQKVADLKQVSVEEVARITTENSKRVFGI